ncbi:hypothetical protein Mal4_54420 [Maioricimonas rarisocia]|uniref:Fe2OG dioxygenase domain-containing protein n=1 Tax=Maioricimonas rarisocia TaxID=2528026 RepID=A0A517ZF15_9PLAN|nr:hypothetical protein [Maioricimonas rarisocia]QDU41077.1 hypothetical protein Mal4_54420 [Maioricimonas rarisocia]
MNGLILSGSVLATGAAATGALFWRYRIRRRGRYSNLAALRPGFLEQRPAGFRIDAQQDQARDAFRQDLITRVDDALAPETFSLARTEASAAAPHVERSYVPAHKQGGTISYESMHELAPTCLAIYHSPVLRDWLSEVIGDKVVPTADYDQSSCSLLVYDRAGDHIGWHYDHNFYRGRHFTVLISLINRSAAGELSASLLQQQRSDGSERTFDTSENTLVLFEGARVRHRATAIAEGDLRTILSMTYSTDPRTGPIKELARRVKDMAFFGLRALWD